jgi:PPOX class probable F420-dependent enzyme
VNPVWFFWNGTHIQIGLMARTQKYVNLMRDPRIAIAIAHPDNPYRYLEVRGRIRPIEPDIDDAVFTSISTKYTGGPFSLEEEGTARFVGTIEVEGYTFQDSDGIPSPG